MISLEALERDLGRVEDGRGDVKIVIAEALIAIVERLDALRITQHEDLGTVAEMVHEGTYFDHPAEFR
jgi:hypothetical protein